ncbi:MAG: 16S rRNA (cytosine(967)-C(5))-methyltransferase RsmB [Candidatus Cloacimonetes bacterium]|nr:16S rRNA (cytosine(967)-C(5))-methyltransferase RsmB [Candidatus Cloacimonadota bacterium]MCF7813910.1 16S rRNA (cytosine(967)-C(5))-methyltransferase RsmB [Candidatus Cloacimonadota bacterium]MCF7868507.1 16S rRNA (cytosine(967)-C(5))-methyltransferase RsmB [Candidatus Cloacimonadota bacterium]MCF7884022.1 16S rRNA (cytosine(967)-C(5))-methyltransferase RsmB [Candidatus Cloacimonadota bacterium]
MNVRLEAYKIIYKVISKSIFSDKLLQQMSKKIKSAGEESQLLYLLVKGVIKMYKNLDYIASFHTDKNKWQNTNLKFKILIYIGLYQLIYTDNIPEHAAVNETVDTAKKLFGSKVANFVNAVLRSYLRSPEFAYPEDLISRLSIKYSFPEDIIQKWLEYWGEDDTTKLCKYYNQAPKLHFRSNHLATDPDKLKKYFERRNIQIHKHEFSENMFVTDQATAVLNDVAFSEGYFSIQDTSAALVVELLEPKMHESILDLFAAPGGKATYISELMVDTGELIAVDKFPNKIKKLKQAMERLKLTNITAIAEDAFNYGPVAPAFDKVLLDVPCSGWGVFQKKAELRWQQNQNIKKLLKLQENALKTGASFVKENGFLIYSTCTLNQEENERQIEKFLARNKMFKLIPAKNILKSGVTDNGYLKTLPFKHNMDGAFAAKMQKID